MFSKGESNGEGERDKLREIEKIERQGGSREGGMDGEERTIEKREREEIGREGWRGGETDGGRAAREGPRE